MCAYSYTHEYTKMNCLIEFLWVRVCHWTWSSLVGHQEPKELLYWPPQHWNYKYYHAWLFYMVLGIKLKSSCLLNMYFILQAISSTLKFGIFDCRILDWKQETVDSFLKFADSLTFAWAQEMSEWGSGGFLTLVFLSLGPRDVRVGFK